MAEPKWDVVVVGAGPVGLSLALGLAQEDRPVLLLEKQPGTSEHSRAPIIWPRTQEVFAGLGLMGRFEKEGIVRRDIRLWDVDRERALLRFPIEELRGETPFPQLLLCPQSRTEQLLLKSLREEPSAEVRFSAEVTGLDHRDGVVEAQYERKGTTKTAAGAFLAGCDGAHSRVRDAVADTFEGRTYRMRAALADLAFEETQDVRYPRMTWERGMATAVRIDDTRWRVIMPRRPQGGPSLTRRIERAVADLFSTEAYETTWKSEFRLHRRVSKPFVRGRVALAGDAAHLTSPVGGQGMNLGVQDAAALGNALSVALNSSGTAPLAGYAAERREAIEGGAVRATDRLTQVLLARRGTFLLPALQVAGALLRVGPVRRLVMRRMAMLDDPSRNG